MSRTMRDHLYHPRAMKITAERISVAGNAMKKLLGERILMVEIHFAGGLDASGDGACFHGSLFVDVWVFTSACDLTVGVISFDFGGYYFFVGEGVFFVIGLG